MANSALPHSLASKLADLASSAISNVVRTSYTHKIFIDDVAGIYLCDCSAFAEHLLRRVALPLLTELRDSITTGDSRPLARDFYNFFHGLLPAASSHGSLPLTTTIGAAAAAAASTPAWRRIPILADARRGDILTWTLSKPGGPVTRPKGDTGHVVIISHPPRRLSSQDLSKEAMAPADNNDDNDVGDDDEEDGNVDGHEVNKNDEEEAEEEANDSDSDSDSPILGPVFAVQVYDASEIPHFDDSRGAARPEFKPGIGRGTIWVDVDVVTGAPTGFRFHAGANRHAARIEIGRVLGLDRDGDVKM